jgi:hypothetical protein
MNQSETDVIDTLKQHAAAFLILRYFRYDHLPEPLASFSRPFAELALRMVASGLNGPEASAGLRKLLEAKDCFVRSSLDRAKP